MKNTMRWGLAALLAFGMGCGNDEEPPPTPPTAATPAAEQAQAAAQQAQAAAQQAQATAQQAQAATQQAAGGSNFGTVTLSGGFMPDPHVVNGTSGGGVNAATMNTACNGWVSGTPDHLFVATGAMSDLRIVAHATADITLVVQKPDGSYACNDDSSEGLNPLVEMPAVPAGTYKVWVGSYEQGTTTSYRLGFSELASTMPSTIAG
ncbi:MAG: hypothetical protein AAGF12_23980 [Myxococcota bacterium]